MNATIEQNQVLNHDEIAKLAIQIWLVEGCQRGRELEHWLRAERIESALERELLVAGHQGNGRVNSE